MGTPFRDRPQTVLVVIILLGIVLRGAYILLFVDLGRDSYWEYGEIAKNLLAGKGYSLYHSDGLRNSIVFDPGASPDPSAWMAPGYVAFLAPFLLISPVVLRNSLLLIIQIALGAVLVFAIYRFTFDHVSQKAAPYAAAIAALLPEFIYATASFTPTLLYQIGVVVLLGQLYPTQSMSVRTASLLGLLFATMIYLRSEFLLFAFMATLVLAFRRQVRSAIVLAAVVVVLLLPWQIRNLSVFGEWVPLTTSAGLNLFRGHNVEGLGAWSDDHIEQLVPGIKHGRRFEIELNALYEARALEFIRTHPLEEARYAVQKAARFWLFDPSDERTLHLIYILPWGSMLLLSVAGLLRSRCWKNHRVPLLFFGYSTMIVVLFFVLPRYQSMMKIALVPFAAVGLEWFVSSVARYAKRRKNPALRENQ